jgi:hypothetical protein
VNLNESSRDDWMLGGVALLLVIDLLFLPWFGISVGPLTATTTERLSPSTSVPNLGGSRTQTRWSLSLVAVGFVALKFVHIHFHFFGFAFYAAVVLCVALALIARQANTGGGYRPEVR